MISVVVNGVLIEGFCPRLEDTLRHMRFACKGIPPDLHGIRMHSPLRVNRRSLAMARPCETPSVNLWRPRLQAEEDDMMAPRGPADFTGSTYL